MAKEYPIIFSAPMVRALLEGRKTQTRRLAWRPAPVIAIVTEGHPTQEVRNPSPWQRVQPGDRLWVRETFAAPALMPTQYRADPPIRCGHWDGERGPWKPAIHMPRWASRLTLTVTAVRVQRLQEISEDDAQAEGIVSRVAPNGHVTWHIPDLICGQSPRRAFRLLWDALHGPTAWEANPEVVALSFTVARAARGGE